MSVVSADRRRRWAAVAFGAAALVGLPAGWSATHDATRPTPGEITAAAPDELVRRVLASWSVEHAGLVESRGGLSVPDLPRLGRVAALFGETVRARVWWSSPSRWRADTLALTGEQGTYASGGRLFTWDYERNVLISRPDAPGVRLPRVDDLLPPQVARRLLGAIGRADRLEVHPAITRVAGRQTWGLTVVQGDPRGTLDRVEVRCDLRSGLPMSVTVRGADGEVVLATRFVEVTLGPPTDAVLARPSPPGASRDRRRPDVIEEIDRLGPWALPDRLGGFSRSESIAGGGSATYGEGLARFVVLPLPPGLGPRVLDAARAGGATRSPAAGGTVVELRRGVLSVVAAADPDGDRVYLLSGPVRGEQLTAAAGELLTRPPERRR